MALEFGIYLPDSGPLANPDAMATIARHAESGGLNILALSDHLVIPTRRANSTYPYSDDGQWPLGNDCLELLSTLGFIAGMTTRARLLTSVMVLPYRPPVMTAKALATLDVLSKGRVIAGCGVGWLCEEFEAIGAPPFEDRGNSSDEFLQVFKELWTAERPQHEGRYVRFSNIDFLPKPIQKPHPPIWIGGESIPALRRTARFGDVWYPISNNPKSPLGTVAQFNAAVHRLHREADEIGRARETIGLAFNPATYDSHQAHQTADGERVMFTGTPAQIVDDTHQFAELGVTSFVFSLPGANTDEICRELDRLIETVIRALK